MKFSSVFVALFLFVIGGLSAEYVINENIQNWTDHLSAGNYSQTINAGTVSMTLCKVLPGASANGAGSAGCVQLYNSSSILELPQLTNIGSVELALGSSPMYAVYLQINKGSGWENVKRFAATSPAQVFSWQVNHLGLATLRLATASGSVNVYDIRVSDYYPPQIPTAQSAQDVSLNSFTARWNQAEEGVAFLLDVYQKQNGSIYQLEDLEGYDDGTPPDGWVYSGTDVIRVNETSAHSGQFYCYFTNRTYYIRSGLLSGLNSLRFWAKAYSATSSFTLKLQKSTDLTTWQDVQSWIANGSNTGDITTAYQQMEVPIDIPGSFYIRWTDGLLSFIDDIEFGYPDVLRNHHINSLDVGANTSYQVTGLSPNTDYYYVVRAVEDGVISYESNEVHVFTTDTPQYDFPTDVPVVIDNVTLTFTEGYANLSEATPGNAPNPSFIPVFTEVLDLLGSGPWNISIEASILDCPWITYQHGGTWRTLSNNSGTVSFQIEATKENLLEIQAGSGDNPTLPVVLTAFTANINPYNHVSLSWVTQSETNALGYYVFRASNDDLQQALMVSDLIEATNTSQQQMYCFTDSEALMTGTYWYWLESRDLDGSFRFHGPVSLSVGDPADDGDYSIPLISKVDNVYPNPFNPVTRIPYQLAKDAQVEILIYNVKGQVVKTYPAVLRSVGAYSQEWNGLDDTGRECASGVYRIVVKLGKELFVRKAALVK